MKYFRILGFAALLASAANAQHVISARSGLVHYTEGKVFLADKEIVSKAAEFPEVKQNQVIRTELGRAEILLTPGVVLRIAENSALRMIANALENSRVELLTGSALLEAGEVDKNAPIVVSVGQTTIEFAKQGLFRIDADPARLRVYEGSAVVLASDQSVTIKEGKQTLLAGVISPEKFNKEVGDAFHRWAGRRAGYIAMANLAGAKSVSDSNIPWRASSWLYNPYFGSFTYIPYRGRYDSPFGWSYYSPQAVERVYYRPPVMPSSPSMVDMGGHRSYGDMGGRGASVSSGSSGGYGAPPPSSSPAPAAAAPRSVDSGSSREGRGGR